MEQRESLPSAVAADVASVVIPGSGPVLSRLWTAVRNEWNVNRSAALRAAESVSGMTREDLADQIEEHPELVPLVTRLLWEAAMTGQTSLLEAMGAAFGAAIHDLGRTPEYEAILGGLRNLRGEDVRVLRHIQVRHVFHEVADIRTAKDSAEHQTIEGLAGRSALREEDLIYSLVRLVSQGFATSLPVLGGTRYTISSQGEILTQALAHMGAARPQ